MAETLYVVLIVFLAGLVQGFTGFGSVLLSLPLLALFLDIKTAVPLMSLAGQALTIFLIIPLWKHLDWKKVWPLVIGTFFGVPVGVYLLVDLDSRAVMIIIGLILLAYGLYGLLVRSAPRLLKKGWAYFFGFIAGCLGGGFSTNGPPAIVYTSLQPWNKDEIKSTIQGYFAVSGFMVIAAQGAVGLMTQAVLHYFYISILPIMAGTYLGHFLYGKIPEIIYRRIIFVMLIALGVFTIWKS